MIRPVLLAAIVAALWPLASARADDAGLLAQALRAADQGDWAGAASAAQSSGPLASEIIQWKQLREHEAPFGAYFDFIARHPDWPGLKLLRKKGEAALQGSEPADQVLSFFGTELPQTGRGSLVLANAHRARGDADAAAAEAVRGWRSLSLTPDEQAAILAAYGDILAEHHDGRMAAMLRAGLVADARRMLPLASDNTRRVAEARIALQEDGEGIDALIAAVPDKMAGSWGLAYDRFRWRILKDKYDGAGDLMLERSDSAESLGDPGQWADWRRKLARREMRQGDPARAYRMAARHHLTPDAGEDYADLEWLAGYIALRKLGDAQTALTHFDRFAAAVDGPISLGRAGYWRGRALEALDRPAEAQAAYAEGARYQTSFYGLLSAEKVGLPLSPALAGGEAYPDWRQAAFVQSPVFQAGQLLMQAGDQTLAARFMLQLAEGLSGEDIGRIAGLANEMNEAYVALALAKAAADKGVIWPSAYFPVVGMDRLELPVRTELALAIARRESEFNPIVVSHAGALGLMQVMPDTARMMADKTGLGYDRAKLTGDWQYNARLGAAYLDGLIEEFGPSPLLVATGYNAGPGRSRKWIAELGDPRADGVDPVDWIEHIPFRETQTYVMRVAESLPIYRARIGSQSGPVSFWEELKGR